MPTQDQSLINNLIQQQNTSAYSQQMAAEVQSVASESHLQVARVVTAKYKIYVIILLILSVIVGANYVPKAWSTFQTTQEEYSEKQQKNWSLDEEIAHITSQKKTRKIAEHQQDLILSCINDKTNCDSIDPSVSDQLHTVRSYLQLWGLKSDKMGVDEKKILKNLDQYLIRSEPSSSSSPRNGEIHSIEIWSGTLIDQKSQFYKIPISVKVVFPSKDELVSFVDNIEKYIISEPNDRILYHIEEVSYDMMAYSESQETELKLVAYYFK